MARPRRCARAFPLQSVWRATWGWMAGRGPAAPLNGAPDSALLHDAGTDENRALSAAYELAARGEAGVTALARALAETHGDNLADDRKITSDSGYQYKEAPAARVAAYGLAAAGAAAVPALVEATRSRVCPSCASLRPSRLARSARAIGAPALPATE